ncbi:MAG TPA: carboxypeptidase regulatory-like domain-containing protein [Planctomycetes bacterium]|nr:carboxypeptidase regulatory-like domain-containing protein [Planctomycetota bacterium]
MNRGVLLACCGILFLLSAAITSRLANDDGPFEPRQVPQPIIADAPTIVVPQVPETDSRREQLKRIISSIEAPDLEPALPIVGMVRMEDGTPIAGATIVARSQLERVATSAVDREERLIQWVEREVQEDRVDADPWQTTSDENGRFELTRLPLTRFLVSAKHPRWSFNRASRSTSPGSLVVFVAQEPKLEVDLQVRLADGSIPARAEVVFAPGRFASLSAANGTLIHGHFDDQGSTHIHQITSALGRRFKPWSPGESTREVESGYHMVIARSADGLVSDPLEVFIEKSDGPQTILLEIPESGAVRVDVVQSVDRVSGFHYFLLQIDRLHPPPPLRPARRNRLGVGRG